MDIQQILIILSSLFDTPTKSAIIILLYANDMFIVGKLPQIPIMT